MLPAEEEPFVYQFIVYVHILAAIAWVGGAFFLQLLSVRTQRSTDPEDLPKLGKQIEYFGLRYFLPVSITVFVAGLILTAQRWSFSQTWISLAMLLWLVSVIIGAVYIGPRTGRVAKLFEAEGPTSAAARALTARLFLVARIDIVIFLVIVALMVYKPGAG
jgi:uncharacterized membrane protein